MRRFPVIELATRLIAALAVVTLSRAATDPEEEALGRWTMVLEKKAHGWIVVHERVSVPLGGW